MKTENYYNLRCKCTACGRTQVRRIYELIKKDSKCHLGRIDNPCCGELQYYTEDHTDAVNNAISVLGYLNATLKLDGVLESIVDTVVEDVACCEDAGQTPQEMGWVGQNGLP